MLKTVRAALAAFLLILPTFADVAQAQVLTPYNVAHLFKRAAAAGGYEGLAATRGQFATVSGGFSSAMSRYGMTATDDLSVIKVAFANFYIDRAFTGFAQYERGNAGVMTIVGAAIEYPIGSPRQRLLFDSGSTTTTVPAAAVNGETSASAIKFSDYLTLNATIPAGAAYRIWFKISNPNGVFYISNVEALSGGSVVDASAGDLVNLNLGTDPPDVSMSGTFTANAGAAVIPIAAVVSKSTSKASVAIVGDSLAKSLNGWGYTDARTGIIQRGIPLTMATINLASIGATAQNTLANSPGRRALYPFVSHAVIQLATNDFGSRTYTQVITDNQAIAAAFPATTKKFIVTVSPRSTDSTSGCTSAGAQTPTNTTVRNSYNDAIKTSMPSGFTGTWDLGSILENDPVAKDNKWKTLSNFRSITDGATTSGSATVTSASQGNFTSADVGTGIQIGSGTGSYFVKAVASSTSLTGAIAGSTASGLTVILGGATIGDCLHFNPAAETVINNAVPLGDLSLNFFFLPFFAIRQRRPANDNGEAAAKAA